MWTMNKSKTECTGKTERSWHAGKPIKKPDYNPDAVTEELVQAVVGEYNDVDEDGSSRGVVKQHNSQIIKLTN